MPRTVRASVGGMIDHALNCANRREPVFPKPADYDAFLEAIAVDEPLPASDLQKLRESVARERSFDGEAWTRQTAQSLGLESTLRNRGRPQKK